MRKSSTTPLILKTIRKLQKASVEDIINNLPEKRSRQWISTLLNRLANSGNLYRSQVGKHVYYVLPENKKLLTNRIFKKLINKSLQEDQVFDELKLKTIFLKDLKENIDSILYYAFTEMLNNAIEHSKSKSIEVSIEKLNDIIAFEVLDKGIGVYNSIMQKKKLSSELEAIQELLKGKTTTLPRSHSGEGIFFTSKVADIFILDGFEYRLRIDNKINDVFVEKIDRHIGTRVRFQLDKNSGKHLNDIFMDYQSKPESYSFDKTKIYVKLFTAGTIYISRSQARRLITGLDKFKVIILDFKGIKTIGQAFADEIFRVFASRHPNIKIETVNTNEAVVFMIKRIKSSKLDKST